MVQNYRTASTRLPKEIFDAYLQLCDSEGVTQYVDLKQHILSRLDGSEVKNEYGKGKGNVGTDGEVSRVEAKSDNPRLDDADKQWFW